MADPKYANLPGIDVESKDCYECGDLPEDDQWKPEELKSASVELVNMDTQTAFEKFRSKYVTGQTNFADPNKVIGYKNIPVGEEETVLQKYNRLTLEVAELSKQVSDIKATKKEGDADMKLLDKVKDLEKKLLSEDVKSLPTGNIAQELDVEKALSSIKNLKIKAGATSKTNASGSYEVYLDSNPNQKDLERFFKLEHRLSKLESTIGLDQEVVNVLANHGKSGTLMEAVQTMENKLALLDSEKLPLVDTRLQAILVKINEVNKAMKTDSSADQNKKINYLYNLIQRWDSVCGALPKVHQRLLDLSVVQDKAANFLKNLQHLETVQESLNSKISETEACQSGLEGMLKSNLETIMANVTELSKRFEALSK